MTINFNYVAAVNNEMKTSLLMVVWDSQGFQKYMSVPSDFSVAVAINKEMEILLLMVVWDYQVPQ